MHNRIGFNRLGRKSSHRKALHRNMVTSLIKYERIETTKAKAKEIRRTAEKLVTRAKVDSVHNRRIAAKTIYEKDMVNKLFTEVGPRFTERPGGYTRMMKLGRRSGDAAEMVVLEFLKDEESSASAKNASPKKKAVGSSKAAGSKNAAESKKATGPKKPAEKTKSAETKKAEAVNTEKPVEDAATDTVVKAEATATPKVETPSVESEASTEEKTNESSE